MRCIAYSTSESYTLKKLAEYLRLEGVKFSIHNKEVIHVAKFKDRDKGDIFFFDYGCVVFWNCSKKNEALVLEMLEIFSQNSYTKSESDEFEYTISRSQKKTLMENGIITLSGSRAAKKMVISFALSQSVKLMTFETSVEKTIEETKSLPQHMALYGKVPFSRRQISKQMGRIFIARHSVNLHTNMLDMPEFFWENPEYESLYKMAIKDLDIPERVTVLDRRLEMIQELFSMLGGELNHQHSSLLEWIIIILISVEIILFISKEVLKLV